MNIKALPYIIALGFLFGSTLVVSRFSVGQYDPSTYIGLRLAIASMLHLLVYRFSTERRIPHQKQLWRRATIMGIFGTAIPMTSVVSSLQYQSSGVTSLLLATVPALTIVLAHIGLPDEFLNRRKVFGVTLALGGAIMLALSGENGLPNLSDSPPTGYILVAIAVISSSFATIYARKYMKQFDAFDVASVRMFVASLIILPLSLLTVGLDLSAVTGEGYLALIYAAVVGTFLAMMMSFYNIKRFGATPAVMTAYITPIVAGIGGVIILGEEFTSTMLVGMVVIIVGITLLQRYKKKTVIIPHPPT